MHAFLKDVHHAADRPPRDVMATRLNITYSAYRELETIPQTPSASLSAFALGLPDSSGGPSSARAARAALRASDTNRPDPTPCAWAAIAELRPGPGSPRSHLARRACGGGWASAASSRKA